MTTKKLTKTQIKDMTYLARSYQGKPVGGTYSNMRDAGASLKALGFAEDRGSLMFLTTAGQAALIGASK